MLYLKYSIVYVALMAFLICKAQQIVDMSANNNIDDLYQNGTYYHKDVNNYLDAFTGTWRYEYDTNKEFRIILTKVEMYHDVGETLDFDYYTDGLLINYQKYENGTLIYQSPTLDYPTGSFVNPTKIGMSFTDYERLSAIFNLDLTLTNELEQNNQQEKNYI